jgi:hypothetical protein
MAKWSKGFWETACARRPHWSSCKADLETGRTRFPALEETEKLVLVKTPDRSLSLKRKKKRASCTARKTFASFALKKADQKRLKEIVESPKRDLPKPTEMKKKGCCKNTCQASKLWGIHKRPLRKEPEGNQLVARVPLVSFGSK